MSLADYLAKNYLNADSKADKKSKKRKRKEAAASQGLVIEEEDASWKQSTNPDGEDEDGPTAIHTRSAEFRKAKANNWKTLTGAPASLSSSLPSGQSRANVHDDDAAADAIVASAAAENKAMAADDDEAPTIDDSGLRMESGAKAGLQSAAQLAAQLRQTRVKASDDDDDDPAARAKAQETIYRDASGRIINIAMKRAEQRAKADAEAAAAAQEIEDRRGDVQKAEAAKRREQVQDAKYLTVARYADDKDLNDELKGRDRWNDPAMQFMERKKETTGALGRPLYKGHAPPNRYGIRPGHRWDGVDRSNGFEKEYFAAQNRRKNVRDLEYAWQMDE